LKCLHLDVFDLSGQSFMLHQIRKMMGMAIAMMRGLVPETTWESVFERGNMFLTPMAPAEGTSS
jgi:tRNA pseudouridine38-40 synthase